MAAKLVLTSDAKNDFEMAYDWQEENEVPSGDKFEKAVQRSLKGIAANPLMHQKVFGNVRRGYVRNYSYVVIYEHISSDNSVIVYSIFHTSQDPAIWQQRVK